MLAAAAAVAATAAPQNDYIIHIHSFALKWKTYVFSQKKKKVKHECENECILIVSWGKSANRARNILYTHKSQVAFMRSNRLLIDFEYFFFSQ